MNTLKLKSEIKDILDQVDDMDILEAVRTILEKSRLDPMLRDKLTKRALRSEEDIKNGRLLTRDEVVERTNKSLRQ